MYMYQYMAAVCIQILRFCLCSVEMWLYKLLLNLPWLELPFQCSQGWCWLQYRWCVQASQKHWIFLGSRIKKTSQVSRGLFSVSSCLLFFHFNHCLCLWPFDIYMYDLLSPVLLSIVRVKQRCCSKVCSSCTCTLCGSKSVCFVLFLIIFEIFQTSFSWFLISVVSCLWSLSVTEEYSRFHGTLNCQTSESDSTQSSYSSNNTT